MAESRPLQEVLQEVFGHIQALYHEQDPTKRRNSDRFLDNFQGTVEAWQVADNLLHTDVGDEVHFYGAQLMRTKVRFDLHELPESALTSLRDSIVQLIIKFQKKKKNVLTQLCLSLADLAVQMPGWTGVVSFLTTTFASNPDSIVALLELLTVLPEEASSNRIPVPEDRRRHFSDTELRSCAADVLKYLYTLATSAQLDSEGQRKVFSCFASWINVGDVPTEEMVSNPLLTASFDAIRNPELFEESVDVVVEVLRSSACNDPALMAVVVPRAMGLVPLYQEAMSREDDDAQLGLARIFTEMSEAYVSIVAEGSNEALQIAEIMVEIAGNPNNEISSMSHSFWHYLCGHLLRLPEPSRSEKGQLFLAMFGRLVMKLDMQLRYADDYEKWTRTSKDEFSKFRYSIAYTLQDVCSVIGAVPVLTQMAHSLQSNMAAYAAMDDASKGTVGWSPIEANLYVVRSIGRYCPIDESTIMPEIMKLIPSFPGHPYVQYTLILIIGKYGLWLNRNATFLNAVFPFIIQALTQAATAPPAALAFNHLCRDCKTHMVGNLPSLIQVFENAVSLSKNDHIEVIEGVGAVISMLELREAAPYVQSMTTPFLKRLAQMAENPAMMSESGTTDELLRLTAVFQHVRLHVQETEAHPLVDIFGQAWGIIEKLFSNACAAKLDMVVENLCRLVKHALRATSMHFVQAVSAIVPVIHASFGVYQHPALLYLGSVVFAEFSTHPNFTDALCQMVRNLLHSSIQMLRNEEEFISNPEVVQDFFDLTTRCLHMKPDVVIIPELIAPIMERAVVSLYLHHRSAFSAAVSFLNVAIRNSAPNHNGSFPAPLSSVVHNVMTTLGPSLIRKVLGGIVSEVSSTKVTYLSDILWHVMHLSADSLEQWMRPLLDPAAGIVPAHVPNQEREKFLRGICHNDSSRDQGDVVGEFSRLARTRRQPKQDLQ